MISTTHLYAAAIGSVTLYCNYTTSNLMATAPVQLVYSIDCYCSI